MRLKLAFLAFIPLLASCSSKPEVPSQQKMLAAPQGGFLLQPSHSGQAMFGDFAGNPAAEQFIDKMVEKHDFDRQQLHNIIGQANDWIMCCD